MSLALIDEITVAGSGVNEDRIGHAGDYAWVIDGATDVLDAPLTSAPTDADWIAGTLDAALEAHAIEPQCAFAALPGHLAAVCADLIAATARRQPQTRHEHPSAAGLVVKCSAGVLSYFAIADCTMLVARPGEEIVRIIGSEPGDVGDARLRDAVRRHQRADPAAIARDPAILRDLMREDLKAMRAAMNRVDGYGVLSITPTPERFIRSGFISVAPGTRMLLASDGFMRLVDVFQRYDDAALVEAADAHGLGALLTQLRAIEQADRAGASHPRVKPSDDASAMLLRA